MFASDYDVIEDEYTEPSISMIVLDYLYRSLCNCFYQAYRQSPVMFTSVNDPYMSDSDMSENTFLNHIDRR